MESIRREAAETNAADRILPELFSDSFHHSPLCGLINATHMIDKARDLCRRAASVGVRERLCLLAVEIDEIVSYHTLPITSADLRMIRAYERLTGGYKRISFFPDRVSGEALPTRSILPGPPLIFLIVRRGIELIPGDPHGESNRLEIVIELAGVRRCDI
jgi:hypothetical protein